MMKREKEEKKAGGDLFDLVRVGSRERVFESSQHRELRVVELR